MKTNKRQEKFNIGLLFAILFSLSIFAVFVTVFSLGTLEITASTDGYESLSNSAAFSESRESVQELYNVDGEPDFILVNFKPRGYAILHRETGEALEYNVSAIRWRKHLLGAH
ncbi:MAG: hypothetical protein LBT55_01865 [Clostridiaceae bacterium]|jgi:hypothetical protein|nr:hypothetical protein [Clostridiaceae bacterium]